MKIKNIFRIVKNLLVKHFYKKPNVLSSIDTVDYIVKNRCSISRYGDGELSVMEGIGISFQDANETLAKKLKNVAKNTDTKMMVCIPDIFDKKRYNKKILKDSSCKFWDNEKLKREFLWRKYFESQSVLGDALISRFYMRNLHKSGVDEYVKKLKKIWDKRDIIFIEGKDSRLGYHNNLFDNSSSIKRILCPQKNAFDKYDEIVATIQKEAKKSDLIVLALGPTATAMAYDLHKLGFQALDLGHIDIEYEWFRMKATEKVPIPSKHVNECNSLGETSQNNLDKEYLDQIVARLY